MLRQERVFLYVANWKMRLTYDQVCLLAENHKRDFERLATLSQDKKIVLCPSYDALSSVAHIFKKSPVLLGAQNCSSHLLGNYTGEVSAESLAQLGCRFCIIGHSERRQFYGETSQEIAHKIEQLAAVGITPLLCVGETREQYDRHETLQVVTQQMKDALKKCPHGLQHTALCVAYEPVWAIGTGAVASVSHIEGVIKQLTLVIQELALPCQVLILYGGSVDSDNASELKSIHGLGGFLIGGASLDFQKFEKIVT